MKNTRIKYLASYEGPSYGSWGSPERMDGFTSIKAAELSMWCRQNDGCDTTQAFIINDEQYWVWAGEDYTRFPATTPEDCMELYEVIGDGPYGSLQVADSPSIRLTVGLRGGVTRESY